MQRHIGELQIALSVESIGNMRRGNGEVDEGLDHEGPCKLGKVLYSESNDGFSRF